MTHYVVTLAEEILSRKSADLDERIVDITYDALEIGTADQCLVFCNGMFLICHRQIHFH